MNAAKPLLTATLFLTACATSKVSAVRADRTKRDMAELQHALYCYKVEFARYPRGDTARIIKQLTTPFDSSGGVFFMSSDTQRIRDGLLLDWWDTPYRIVTTQTAPPVITSAGPNRVFGDSDDLVSREWTRSMSMRFQAEMSSPHPQ